jgi:hypothetical protein
MSKGLKQQEIIPPEKVIHEHIVNLINLRLTRQKELLKSISLMKKAQIRNREVPGMLETFRANHRIAIAEIRDERKNLLYTNEKSRADALIATLQSDKDFQYLLRLDQRMRVEQVKYEASHAIMQADIDAYTELIYCNQSLLRGVTNAVK